MGNDDGDDDDDDDDDDDSRSQAGPQQQGQPPSMETCEVREYRDSGEEAKSETCINDNAFCVKQKHF